MTKSSELDDRGIVLLCPKCRQRNRLAYERFGQACRCGNCQTQLELPDEPVEIKTETAFNALSTRSALPVLVDFWAQWCGPCKMMAPELTKVAADTSRQCLIAKVNTELLPGVAQRLRISGIPTLILFQSGREIARQSGAIPATAIRQFIQQNQPAGKTA